MGKKKNSFHAKFLLRFVLALLFFSISPRCLSLLVAHSNTHIARRSDFPYTLIPHFPFTTLSLLHNFSVSILDTEFEQIFKHF